MSKEYKFKEEWVKVLEKQIATSKNQEEELLKNITDAVFVLNPQFDIVYQNLPSTKLSGYQKEILGQDFFKYFSFKDKEGRTLEPYSIPFEQTLSSKTQSILQNVQIQGNSHVQAKVPSNTITVTNVCIVYQDEGTFSGGIAVMAPETASYRYNGNDAIFLWLPNQGRLKVEWLSVTPISSPKECVGIF